MKFEKTTLFILTILFWSLNAQAKYLDSTSYNELVFPSDLNEFPIIIQDGGIKKGQIKSQYVSNTYKHIELFVFNQREKSERDVQFFMEKDINKLPVETHPYLVKMQIHSYTPLNRVIPISIIAFKILDRRSEHFHRFSGKLKSMMVMMDKGYREKDVTPYTAKKYFKELSRILDNQDKMTKREFQLEERKVQKRRDRRGVNIGLGIGGAMVLAGGIVGIVSTF